MSSTGEPLDDRHDAARPPQHVHRKLGKLPPADPLLLSSRTVHCNLCGRNVFSRLLLTHKQLVHDDAVYTRTASGHPKGLWSRLPAPSVVRMHRQPRVRRPLLRR
jgi:hypothetical protein